LAEQGDGSNFRLKKAGDTISTQCLQPFLMLWFHTELQPTDSTGAVIYATILLGRKIWG
jgi:hypothetical protein